MKCFVTGATGFLGGHLVRQLCNAEHEVVALVRDPSRAGELSRIGARLARGDVTDKESMRAPMTGVDGVFHVAGWYKVGVKDKSAGRAVHIDGTRNVLQLMRELCALPSTRVQEKRRTATGLTRWGSNASRSAWRCSARRS